MKWLLFAATAVAGLAQTGLDFPMSLASSPSATPEKQLIAVLSAGAKASITTYTAGNMKEVSRVTLDGAWLGLTFAPNGKTLYAGGGSRGSIYEFSVSPQGELKQTHAWKASDFIGDIALSPDGHLIYAADVFKNVIVVVNPQSGRVIDQFKTGRRPYRIVFHPDGKSYFVSSWADATVYQYNVANGEEIGRLRLAQHPTDMVISGYRPSIEEGQTPLPWRYRLFVAAANTNNVFAIGINENKTMRHVDTLSVAPAALTPLGMTPSALALTADQKRLYVACSDANAVAVFDVSDVRAAGEALVETGAYPIAILALGKDRAVVASARANSLTVLGLESAKDWAAPPEAMAPAQPAEHVIYIVKSAPPAETMHALAGFIPDFTVKLAREKTFDIADPGNLPPAGYLWTNALSAGISVYSYGVFERGGKALDPALAPYAKPPAAFLEDLKMFDADGKMPRLILIQTDDATNVREAIGKTRFRTSTQVVESDPHRARALLGLRPTTLHDAVGDGAAK
ncbi:MAG: YncE family protein [Bryobacteraceae bacterium]